MLKRCQPALDKMGKEGTYPLHMAVSCGKPEFVKALADKSLKSSYGKTAYGIAKDDNKTTLLALLKP